MTILGIASENLKVVDSRTDSVTSKTFVPIIFQTEFLIAYSHFILSFRRSNAVRKEPKIILAKTSVCSFVVIAVVLRN